MLFDTTVSEHGLWIEIIFFRNVLLGYRSKIKNNTYIYKIIYEFKM